MNSIKKASLQLILFVLASSTAFAQNLTINGHVLESANNSPIPQVTVRIYKNDKDTTFVKGGVTDQKGEFTLLSIPKGKYLVRFDCLGFVKTFKAIELKVASKTAVSMGTIRLTQSDFNLKETTVIGRIPEVVVKQDTLEYNPEAFKLQPGSVVEDMLKRMSGVEIDTDGKIKVAGKEVKKVYVDGKEFFANDPTVATKNFTTDMIDRIQVIDRKSDMTILTGIDDGEEQTVINLTIKKGMKKGWLGNLQSGAGREVSEKASNDIRYEANALLNHFQNESQLTLLGNTNNTNNNPSRDWGGDFGQQMGMRGGRGGGGNSSGITTAGLLGVNTAYEVNKKLKIGGNIRYNHVDNVAEQTSTRKNLLQDSVSFNDSKSSTNYISDNFNASMRMEYRPDSAWTFIFTPTLSVNRSTTNSTDTTSLMAGYEKEMVNHTGKESYNKNNMYNVNAQLDIAYDFKKKGRRMSLSFEAGRNEADGDGSILAQTHYFRTNRDITQDQQIINNSYNNSFRINTTFAEPIGVNNFLQFSYSLRTNDSHSDKYSYNKDNASGLYSLLDTIYSKSLDNSYINQQIGTSFRVVREKYGYTVGIDFTPSTTSSKTYLLDSVKNYVPSRSVVNYAPNLNYTYRFDRTHNLRIDYRGQSRQPSITQLDPSKTQSSSTSISFGNPDLLPTFNNNMTIRYTGNNRETQQSVMMMAQGSYVINSIVNKTSYDSNGNRTTTYDNVNGEWNGTLALMLNSPIGKSKFQVNTYTTASYNNQIGYISSRSNPEPDMNTSNTLSMNENLGFIFRNDWLYSQLRGNVRYAKSVNSIASMQGNETMTNSVSYNAQITFPHGISLSSDIRYSQNKGFSSGYSKSETIWNADISKTIFKRNNGTIRLKIYDILRQQLNYNWTSTAQYVMDSQYNTLTSYFMLFFNYRFNAGMGGRSMNRGDFRSRDMNGSGGGFRGEGGGGGFRGEGGSSF